MTASRFFFFCSSRRRHTRCGRDWSSDVCSSDLIQNATLFAREQKARVTAEASEQRFRGLFDGVPVGLLRSTPAGRITQANPTLVQMLGYPDPGAHLAVKAKDLYGDSHRRRRFPVLDVTDGGS